MSDNLVLEHLRAIRSELREVRNEQTEQHIRIGAIERSMARVEVEQAELRAGFGRRFDQVLDRLDRISRRLEIAPAH